MTRRPRSVGLFGGSFDPTHVAHLALAQAALATLALDAIYWIPAGLAWQKGASATPAADRAAMLDWVRHQRMALHAHGILMVHGGVLPSWTVSQTLSLAGEVEAVLRSPALADFLQEM